MVTNVGREIGTRIRNRIPKLEQPSISAASSSSRGMVRFKEERRDIFSGKPVSDRRIRRPPVFVSGADG